MKDKLIVVVIACSTYFIPALVMWYFDRSGLATSVWMVFGWLFSFMLIIYIDHD